MGSTPYPLKWGIHCSVGSTVVWDPLQYEESIALYAIFYGWKSSVEQSMKSWDNGLVQVCPLWNKVQVCPLWNKIWVFSHAARAQVWQAVMRRVGLQKLPPTRWYIFSSHSKFPPRRSLRNHWFLGKYFSFCSNVPYLPENLSTTDPDLWILFSSLHLVALMWKIYPVPVEYQS